VTRVWAGEAQKGTIRMAAIREKKYFSPTRPAMGESKPIGAIRRHRRSKDPGCGAMCPGWVRRPHEPPTRMEVT